MYNESHDELIQRLYEMLEQWENSKSYTGDISYDIGIEQAYFSCIEDLKDLLESL